MGVDGSTVQSTPRGVTNSRPGETSEDSKDGPDTTRDSNVEAIRGLVTYARELVVSILLFMSIDKELTVC